MGPPKRVCVLEGKWDPGYFREMEVGEFFMIWPESLHFGGITDVTLVFRKWDRDRSWLYSWVRFLTLNLGDEFQPTYGGLL